jgi:hypothetical protein
MAQQTAMQKLIEDIRNNNDICFLNDGHIEYYFEMEKEQILNAFVSGSWLPACRAINSEIYYNETYKK